MCLHLETLEHLFVGVWEGGGVSVSECHIIMTSQLLALLVIEILH